MSLASEFQKQISALPAPPLLHDSSDGELKTALSLEPNLFKLTPDTEEHGTETESQIGDESELLGSGDYSYDESNDDALIAPGADSSVATKAALAQRIIQRLPKPKIDQKIKEALDDICNLLYKLICSLLDKRCEVRIEPIHIDSLLWVLN